MWSALWLWASSSLTHLSDFATDIAADELTVPEMVGALSRAIDKQVSYDEQSLEKLSVQFQDTGVMVVMMAGSWQKCRTCSPTAPV